MLCMFYLNITYIQHRLIYTVYYIDSSLMVNCLYSWAVYMNQMTDAGECDVCTDIGDW